MPKGPGPDDPGTPRSSGGSSSAEPDALTAEDIFGEILDEVEANRPRVPAPAPTAPAASRKGPIKVQVSEPSTSGPRAPRADSVRPPGRPAVRELLPEDVAALLDAFSEPAEAVTRAQAAAPEAPAAPDEPPPAPSVAPPAFEPAPAAGKDEPIVIDVDEAQELPPLELEEAPAGVDDAVPQLALSQEEEEAAVADEASPPMPVEMEPLPPPPPVPGPGSGDGTDEGLRDLMNLMRLSKGRQHRMASGPNKFRAATPAPESERGSLDLGMLVEQAFDEAAASATPPAPPVSARLPEPGKGMTYGPYRLLQRIAVGGMAEVFRAKRTGVEGFEKVVAVKRILPHLSDNKEFVDMFIAEAKMVAGLTHPSIVQIFDLGKIEKTYFIAMDYVHGRDLRTILRRAREKGLRMPLDLAVLIVSRVCSALEFAHRKKDERGRPMLIVHRDVSPQNILISFEGEVKLTDFGIAKAATKATITDVGALRGKLLYMSPEQAWGRPIDRRSDLFSLGIVFYEAVTDQKPFASNSEMSILEMVRESRVIPPTEINPRIPPRLERALLKALARDVEERYQDAAEMYKDLERVLHERQPPTAIELARFLEVLFDDSERTEAVEEEMPASLPEADTPGELHVEFDHAAGGQPEAAAPAPAPARDPMSIQKLLKRFGIK